MKLKDQAMLANLAIFGGMVWAYFQGFPMLYIVGCGVGVFVVVSAIFLYRIKKARRRESSGQ
jgi:ABC-type antimicrobial peptide transport system permease subunit